MGLNRSRVRVRQLATRTRIVKNERTTPQDGCCQVAELDPHADDAAFADPPGAAEVDVLVGVPFIAEVGIKRRTAGELARRRIRPGGRIQHGRGRRIEAVAVQVGYQIQRLARHAVHQVALE